MFEIGDWVVVTPRYLLMEGVNDYSKLGKGDKIVYNERVGEIGVIVSPLYNNFFNVCLPNLSHHTGILCLSGELEHLKFPQLILEV